MRKISLENEHAVWAQLKKELWGCDKSFLFTVKNASQSTCRKNIFLLTKEGSASIISIVL